jgi:hypothetical protein
VQIAHGFPGLYKWNRGMSYYFKGDSKAGEIHFTVPGNEEMFADFHITRSITGSNVQIWYKNGKYSNINKINLPPSKQDIFKTWWGNNQAACNEAAADFWAKMNVCDG